MSLLENLKFNVANKSDLMSIFYLANDQLVRASSINQTQITLDEHVKWFENKINSEECIFYVVRNVDNDFIGYIRFDRCVECNASRDFVVSIAIAAAFRGKSLGTYLVKQATDLMLQNKKPDKIYAYIKKNNEASFKCFLRAGYILQGEVIIKNVFCYKLEFLVNGC